MKSEHMILASGSPRRAELLRRILPEFEIVPSGSEENASRDDPVELVKVLAGEKAGEVYASRPGSIVIGADTIVWLDGRRFGKPADDAEAADFLRALSGRTHLVLTGVCVVSERGRFVGAETSRVTFRALGEDFISEYVRLGISGDKAGAYGIQCDPSPVRNFEGNFDNIMGLPLELVKSLLARAVGRKSLPDRCRDGLTKEKL